MAEIIINDVKYTNVPNKKAGTKFASALTQSNIGMSQAVQDYVNSSYFYALINAIDINWDGIDIGENTYINTTSDLIKWIESKAGDIDLSSYATVSYVNQKFEDLIGGAPETLDTLKELADALQEDASLAYVTQALEGKANVNDVYTKTEVDNLIPAPVDLSGYVSYTQANSYYVAKEDMPDMNDYATVSYVTTELDKKADLSDIPSAPDLTPYVTYADANSYYVAKEDMPDLNDYATVSYVTSELDKKADLSDIPSAPDLTPYVTYADANSYYAGKNEIPDMNDYATVSYVTSELDKKADKTDIPSMPDLTNYVSYTNANSYYMTVESDTKQVIHSVKTFVGNKRINFRQGTSTDKLGFNLYNAEEKEVGGLEWRTDTIDGKPLLSLQHYVSTANMSIIPQSYLGFRQTQGNYKYHLLAPIPYDVRRIENISGLNYKNFFMPLVFKNGSNKVYTDCTGLVDMASLMPDMSSYVPMTSYNALVARVEELASWIVSYHTPTPGPTPTPTFAFTYGTGTWTVNNSGMDSVAQWLNNTTGYSPNYSSNNANVTVDPMNGVLSWTNGGEAATITATANAGMYSTSMDVYTNDGGGGGISSNGYWTYNGMNYYESITLSQNDSSVLLEFFSTPAIPSAGTWSFTDPSTSGIHVAWVTGNINIEPSTAPIGHYTVTANYTGDDTYGPYTKTFTIYIEESPTQS